MCALAAASCTGPLPVWLPPLAPTAWCAWRQGVLLLCVVTCPCHWAGLLLVGQRSQHLQALSQAGDYQLVQWCPQLWCLAGLLLSDHHPAPGGPRAPEPHPCAQQVICCACLVGRHPGPHSPVSLMPSLLVRSCRCTQLWNLVGVPCVLHALVASLGQGAALSLSWLCTAAQHLAGLPGGRLCYCYHYYYNTVCPMEERPEGPAPGAACWVVLCSVLRVWG